MDGWVDTCMHVWSGHFLFEFIFPLNRSAVGSASTGTLGPESVLMKGSGCATLTTVQQPPRIDREKDREKTGFISDYVNPLPPNSLPELLQTACHQLSRLFVAAADKPLDRCQL